MLKLYKLKHYLRENRALHLISALIFTAGFIFGGIYVNLITELDFTKASDSISALKEGTSVYSYGYSDEIILLGIFLGTFFLFGKWIISFFIFRYGFLTGYFCVFLIKLFSQKGILPSSVYLFLNLIMILPFVIFLSRIGYTISNSIYACLFKKQASVSDLGKTLSLFFGVFIICLIFISILSRLKMNIFLSFLKNFM